ncbi:MAG: hypothetical protein HRT40_07400 [Campylobacteraceae bacterium]|nr:hypothetical protein [Campylobacteraceae bacterium]
MNLRKILFEKDKNADIGKIRLTSAFVGGLINAYTCICIISYFLRYTIFENIVLVIIILPIIWSSFALWIIMSKTKINAIMKFIIPFIILFSFIKLLG